MITLYFSNEVSVAGESLPSTCRFGWPPLVAKRMLLSASPCACAPSARACAQPLAMPAPDAADNARAATGTLQQADHVGVSLPTT